MLLRFSSGTPSVTSPEAWEMRLTERRNTGSSTASEMSKAARAMSFASCWQQGSRQGISA